MKKIKIFDTTLRDGEQCPGGSLTIEEKLKVARQLAKLNVDIIEAGFAIASPGDFESVKRIAKEVKGPVICSLARTLPADIEAAGKAIKPAKKKRIHTFIATSQIHMKYKLKKNEDEVIDLAVRAVKQARKYTDDIEFSPEDSSRTGVEFLYRILEAVIKAGANTVNIPDTVGYATPEEFGNLIKNIRNNVPNIDDAVISVHCHNDLGLAVANSLMAIKNGAGQVECTINGIGERAGNASLEEIVMAIKTRKNYFKVKTDINTKEIFNTSRLVSNLTGMIVQPNKAIVGANAFAHEAGIHQDGILKKRSTYEIMRAQDIGLKTNRLVLGKHSGRHAFTKQLLSLGYKLNKEQLEKAFDRFKRLADKKKEIYDEDLIAICEDELKTIPQLYTIDYLNVTSGNKTIPTATVRLKIDKDIYQEAACGDGPVDAIYNAILKIIKIKPKPKLLDYSIRAVTHGTDALGEVTVTIRSKTQEITGRGASTDILEASAKAYVQALNRLVSKMSIKKRKGTQP